MIDANAELSLYIRWELLKAIAGEILLDSSHGTISPRNWKELGGVSRSKKELGGIIVPLGFWLYDTRVSTVNQQMLRAI